MDRLLLPRAVRISDVIEGIFSASFGPTMPVQTPIGVGCADPPLTFVEPVAIAMLGAWACDQRESGRQVVVDESLKSIKAAESGLLSAIAGRSCGGGGGGSRFLRLGLELELENAVFDMMDNIIKPPFQAAEQIAHYCMSEFARNVFEHAQTAGKGAFCAVSFDESSARVRLAVADCGRGIPATIKHYEGDLTDVESLSIALEPSYSGDSARDDVNRGVGLYFARRLALAAKGAFAVITEGLCAQASTRTPSSFEPAISHLDWRWPGTAVAVTFNAEGADYSGPMRAIIDEVEGRGPRYSDISFYNRSDGAEDWHVVVVGPDKGKLAIDKTRAQAIAQNDILPRLISGEKVELDFTGVANTTQPFCHALVVPLVRHEGVEVLSRLRFIGCSARTRAPIRFAVNYGLDVGGES